MARAIQTVTELRECAVRRASGDMPETEFRSQFSALLSRVPSHTIREYGAIEFLTGDKVVIVN